MIGAMFIALFELPKIDRQVRGITMKSQISKKSVLKDQKGLVLVVTLLLLSVLVIMGTTAIMAVSTDIKIAGNYRQNQVALYNAEAGVEQVIRYLRTNTVNYPTVNATQSIINGGTCPTSQCIQITIAVPTGFSFPSAVKIYGYNVTEGQHVFRMTGTGPSNASKTIEVNINRNFSLTQSPDGALGMYGQLPTIAGGGAIDGNDHSQPPTDCSGASCHTPADGPGPDLPGLYSTENVDKGSTTITGNPAEVLETTAEALAKDAQWTAIANTIVNSGLYDSSFSSDRANPKITVLTSNLKLSGNNHHYGILVVSGADIEIETVGTFTFEGLIILANGATMTTKGTANTYGSVVTCSHSELTVTLNGTPTLMYSSAAINNLSNINAPHSLHKIAWRDVF